MSDLIRFLSLFAAFFAVAGLLIALGVFRGCARSDSESAIAEEIRDIAPVFNMSANQLVRTYLADEEATAAAYNGSVGIVEGPSFLVNESNHLRFYVDKVWAVRCFLSDKQVERVRDLRSSRERFPASSGNETFEIRGIGSGWPIAFTSLPVFALKGKVEGINNKHLTIDIRGCIVQDSS